MTVKPDLMLMTEKKFDFYIAIPRKQFQLAERYGVSNSTISCFLKVTCQRRRETLIAVERHVPLVEKRKLRPS